jgi:GDP-4-dehydro-6-deoxy-D-mannose reductase
MKNVLITGVNGFCGRHLVKRLLSEGVDQIYGTDIASGPGNHIGLAAYFQVDISDEAQTSQLLRTIRPDSIFHLAGINQGSLHKIYAVNVLGSIHLLESIRLFSPHTSLLIVGSAAEYGNVPISAMPITEIQICKPVGHYGISKYAATLAGLDYAHTYGLKVNVVRPFNIIGAGVPTSLVIGAILERIKSILATGTQNPEILVGNLDTQRDFIAINDVVDAYINIIQTECWGEIFNVCSGEARSIRSILAKLLLNSEKPIGLKVVPELIRSSDVLISYGSFEKAQKTFGFKPKISLDTALKEAWDYAMGGT